MLLLILGCSPCDEDALALALTSEDVIAACDLPPALLDWHDKGDQIPPDELAWSCAVEASDSPRIASRRAVYASCGEGLGDEHSFVFGDGQPLLAVAVADWAESYGLDRELGRSFVGEAIIPEVELPKVDLAGERVELSGDFSTIAADALVSELTRGEVRLAVQVEEDWLHLFTLQPGSAENRVRLLPEGAAAVYEGGEWRYEARRSSLSKLAGPVEVIAEPTDTVEDWIRTLLTLDRPLRGEDDACREPPAGMVCVPAGTVETVWGRVMLPTFYMDAVPVRDEDYAACTKEGFCKPAAADRMSYRRLEEYCNWSGKRVPTEWEWESAFVAGVIGVSDPEWTNTFWYAADQPEFSVDPWGPCGGGYPCWNHSAAVMRGPERTLRSRTSRGQAAGGGRCATRSTRLTTWPPEQLVSPMPVTWTLTELTPEDRAIVAGIAEDAIDEIPVCTDRVGASTTECKDPLNHVVPNEKRYHVVLPYLSNRGGGYVGVASDQNYSFAVEAKSEYAWFLDYDAVIVHLHQIARAVFLVADTREEFVDYYAPDSDVRMEELLDETYADHPDLPLYKRHYYTFRGRLHRHYQEQMQPDPVWGERGWLRTPENYLWIRDLWRMGRARAVKGNMLGDNAMQGIAEAAGKLGVPIRVYYTSNAPNAWGSEMTPSYKRNVRAFPMDERSIVLQVFGFKTGYGQTGYWHYNIQSGLQHQDNLLRHGWLRQVYWPSLPTNDDDVTVSGLPGAAERWPVTRTYIQPTYE